MNTCLNCRFWFSVGGVRGECRRYPPVVAGGIATSKEYSCGEFVSREPNLKETDDD